MPEEIADMRDRYLTAIANSVAAQDAADAAESAEQDAREATEQARTAQSQAARAEREASDAYRAALRANGYVDTASGPRPAPGVSYAQVCECGHTANLHDEDAEHSCNAVSPRCNCRGWHPTQAAADRAAALGRELGWRDDATGLISGPIL
jgi:hypothetical protein